MDIQTQQTELKRLIIKGKDQGFLTYSEINDHLPEGMNDTDQIETVVNMINDMGIDVLDSAPDPDSLLLKTTSDEEEVVEEAEAVLTTAVESEFGRTTDPVRMYMREMGTVDLLTREDEIKLDSLPAPAVFTGWRGRTRGKIVAAANRTDSKAYLWASEVEEPGATFGQFQDLGGLPVLDIKLSTAFDSITREGQVGAEIRIENERMHQQGILMSGRQKYWMVLNHYR